MSPARTLALALFAGLLLGGPAMAAPLDDLQQLGVEKGIIALIGMPDGPEAVVDLAEVPGLTVYFQTDDAGRLAAVRRAAEAAGLLGGKLVVASGSPRSIHLADNIADGILVAPTAAADVVDAELLRALRPRAVAVVGERRLVKPVPAGIDEWSHPFHGPDNNPQSRDELVHGELRTQFLADPKFSPMPEQSVVAGGRIYKAMGHIAHKANQNEWLSTLLCINAYNGTILWKRPLPQGFMIHRNTMIATADGLLMGDHESCKQFDGRTGEILDEITVPPELTDGPVWKWMALRDGVLFALVGNPEIQVDIQRSNRRGLGHWPWGMWKGHDYSDPRTAFGFGRTVVAIDLKTKKLLWHFRDEEFLDARAVCMNSDRLFCFTAERFLACLDAASGKLLWKNSDEDLLEAIGPNGRAQHYITGYATSCYMKCSDDYVFFAGPQRSKLVVASAADGKLLWTHPTGNLQLVLRDDAIYAAGPQRTNGMKLDYATGTILAEFPARRACTRATGCLDSIFYRASGGTVRVLTESNTAQHIAPMRPPCQDGVIVSNGHLYWGPWMCGCQLSLYGNICLAPAKTASDAPRLDEPALIRGERIVEVEPLPIEPGDWPSFRGDNARSDKTSVAIPADATQLWQAEIATSELPTAPVVAGGLVFIADRSGVVRALDEGGELVWKAYTSGPVYYPPAVGHDRVFVGSADGRVYAFEARTGRFLWSYRVGPQERLIPVYGRLISAWPVSGGVAVEGDTVYAAAGIAHYDGTYVVALDAVSGEVKAENSSSGKLSEQVNSGISMQGNLTIAEGELRFLAGGVYETARYDLETLACLNTPRSQVSSQFRTAFYPYYPDYGKYLSLDHTCSDGSTLCFDASYEGNLFTNLALEEPLPPGVPKTKKEAARWIRRGRNVPKPKLAWQDGRDRRFTGFVVSGDRLLAAGHPDEAPEEALLALIDVKEGNDVWVERLPAVPVKGGLAVDHRGRIYAALENGWVVCFSEKRQ